ncbi:hypothetical protein ACF3NT_02835 [Naumannella halotolerans]|uniref:Uncharacterized protein n=1 Tax=Naumannella halotolerans TaxID=993414 RepID=A0A4R7J6I1_9ACTN|nr:hypothetical protein [Naumannella halotolerans]TDT33001.1 hypothetical protein CLV29_0593 [Naumannella halotolerans]
MTIRDWVRDKFARDELEATPVGVDGLEVTTPSHPHAVVVVPDPGPEVFGAPQLEAVVRDYPTVDAILLIRRPADEAAFAAAAEHGIQIDTLGNVTRALKERGELSRFQHPDERYLRSRLGRLPAVRKIDRIGLSAWHIERNCGQASLKIITHDRYEFPASELRGVLDLHPTIRPYAVVITNPNTNGLSTLTVKIARQQGVRLFLLGDFIDNLRRATD